MKKLSSYHLRFIWIVLLTIVSSYSFGQVDSVVFYKDQLSSTNTIEKYEGALNLVDIYSDFTDSLYDLSYERIYIKKAIEFSPDTLSIEKQADNALTLGRNYLNSTDYDSALQVFYDLRELDHVKKDTLLDLEIGEYIANIFQQQNKLPEALSTYHEVILKYKNLKTFQGDYYACLNSCNAAYIQILQKNYGQSIELLQFCYSVNPESERDKKIFRDDLSVNFDLYMARAHEELGLLDSAKIYYARMLETSIDIKYPFTEAYAYLGLGNYEAEANGDYKKAKILLEKALGIFKTIPYVEGAIPTLNSLSVSVQKLGDIQLADRYASEAIELAKSINNQEGLKDGYENLSQIASDLGRHQEAMYYYKKHVAHKDSILNMERDRNMQEMTAKYEKAEDEFTIREKESQLENERTRRFYQLILFIIGALALLALGYYLITRQKLRQSREAANYEKEISTALNKFVPMRFLKALGRDHILDVQLGDQIEQEVTVLFTDIRSFTTISEQMTPIENFQFVKEYAEEMGPIIVKNGGFINQYLGDGIMAIFQSGAGAALQSCVEMQVAVRKFNHERRDKIDFKPIRVGMGLHTGSLVMGIIGDENRQDAALISDTVNTAARLESLTKGYGTGIILSQQTLSKIEEKENFDFRYLGSSMVKGKAESIVIFECINGDSPELYEEKHNYIGAFDEAMTMYFEGDKTEAVERFEKMQEDHKDDLVVEKFLERVKS